MTTKRKSGPSRDAQTVSDTVWYYESRRSLEFCVEPDPSNTTRLFDVPLSMIRKSLARIGPPKKRARKP
jgi:hypothetical protein